MKLRGCMRFLTGFGGRVGQGRMRFRSTLLGVCAISLTQIRQFRVRPTAQQNVHLVNGLPSLLALVPNFQKPRWPRISVVQYLTERVLPAKYLLLLLGHYIVFISATY